MVRATGVEIVSAADLIQRFEASLTREQLESHHRAARALRSIVDETFAKIERSISVRGRSAKSRFQEFVMSRFTAQGLTTYAPPIVGGE